MSFVYSLARSILEQEIAFIWRKHAQKNKHCLFVMLQWASDHGKIVYYIICHINASHVVCFCTETFCVLVTLIGAMRGGRGEAVNCGPQRCSFVAQKIEWAHTGYHPIWILEYISHPEWNWNFELSWTTALASCRCSFRFWQLEDEALRKNMCIERNCCTCCGIKQGWELAMQQATHKNCTLTVTAFFQVGRNTIRSSKNLRPEYNI